MCAVLLYKFSLSAIHYGQFPEHSRGRIPVTNPPGNSPQQTHTFPRTSLLETYLRTFSTEQLPLHNSPNAS